MNSVQEVIARNKKALLSLDGVVAVGRGHKNGVAGEEGIIVSVKKKKSSIELAAADMIPPEIDGVKTDVVESKEFWITENIDYLRPTLCGYSIGHKDITAGTLGCIVKKDGVRMILSNNHVLANSNMASIGDAILQPGPHDGGMMEHQIGTLESFIPITMDEDGGTELPELPAECNIAKAMAMYFNATAILMGRKSRLRAVMPNINAVSQEDSVNYVDAALCLPDNDADIEDHIAEIGEPVGIAYAELDMPIQKSGRTTGYTQDVVLQVDVSVKVNYGDGKIALFEDQVIAGPMSAGGDSGSAVLDQNLNVIGLLFAGSEDFTIINRIQHVFDKLNVSL